METNHLRERYLRLITEKDSVNPESANRLLDFWKRIERAEHALGI